jgi:hypothetical protein
MAKMLPGTLLFATPKCHDCGMLSDPKSTYYGEDFFRLYCESCRDHMDGVIDEIASDLLTDPNVLNAYKHHPKEQQQEMLLTLAEDMYFFEHEPSEPDED